MGSQIDGLAHTVGTIIVDQWGQDAAVGGAVAANLAETDVARLVGKVGDYKNIVFTSLRIGGNHAMLCGIDGVTTTDHFVGGQAIGARCGRVGEGTPATEVNVMARGAIHVNINTARIQYSHVIPGGIGRCVETVVVRP